MPETVPNITALAAHPELRLDPEHAALPGRFFNRELSWLAFNRRVVEESENPRHRLLERLRFLAISAGNLDEFYMVRVAGLREQVREGIRTLSLDGLSPSEQIEKINEEAALLMAEQQRVLKALRTGLAAVADPLKAPQMQAYMKSAMPYHGVPRPVAQRVFTAAFAAHHLDTFEAWRDTLLALWREATHREERYAALDLAARRPYAKYVTREALPVFEEFIETGGWWDVVAHLVGEVRRLVDRAWTTREMRAWSTDEVLWKRRVSIICQLRFKAATDLDLLYACIEANLDDRDFFIRKAIGWALRQYARTDPDEVLRYVTAHADRMSQLSKREALKHVPHPATLTGRA